MAMITLICGPSCVGKSTFRNSGALAAYAPDTATAPMKLALELANGEPIEPGSVVHYNMMRPLEFRRTLTPSPAINDDWTFRVDPVWNRLCALPGPKRAFLIVAPATVLRARARSRREVEPSRPDLGRYDSHTWANVYTYANLGMIYGMCARELRDSGFELTCVTSRDGAFQRIDASDIQAHVRREKPTLYSREQIAEMIRSPMFEYQRVELPHGLATSGQDRAATASLVLPANLAGKSVLDIGSALGALCFEAERRGASQVVGLEPRESRFRASIILKEILNSDAELRCESLHDFSPYRKFDHVLLLNVIHHLKEPMLGLRQAAALTQGTLVVEFPHFSDTIFASTFPAFSLDALNKLPLIGVSSQSVDQTFIFTESALQRVLMDHDPLFARIETMPSPMANRTIAFFHK